MMQHCYEKGALTMKTQQFESKSLLKIRKNYRFIVLSLKLIQNKLQKLEDALVEQMLTSAKSAKL